MSWETRSLIDIANVSTGKWDANHAEEKGKYRFYTCARKHLFSNTKRFSGECLILPGNGANVGDVYYYEGEFDAYQRTYVMSDIKILPRFLMYHMLLNWRAKNEKKQYGSATNFIKIGNFKEYLVSYPPLTVQKQIVEKLDAAFAEIDRAVEIVNERQINTISLIAVVQNSLFEDIPLSIPRLKLSEVAKFENGDRGKNYPSKKYQISEGVPFVNAGDFSLDGDITRDGMAYISEERFDLLGAGKFKKDDVLFCLRGSLGKSAINKMLKRGAIASSLVIIRALQERVHANYLFAFMRSDIVKKYISETAGGTAQPNLSAKAVMGYKIPVPSLEEQKVIADKFWALRQRGLDAISLIEEKKSELMALKIAILNQAFSGKLTKDAV